MHKCKECQYYANTNEQMKPYGQIVQVGDFCLKFKWNLGRVKDWIRKQSNQKGNTLPPMSKLPKGCYER